MFIYKCKYFSQDDGGSSRHSDVELSDDDVREADDTMGDHLMASTTGSLLSESFPNSPATSMWWVFAIALFYVSHHLVTYELPSP